MIESCRSWLMRCRSSTIASRWTSSCKRAFSMEEQRLTDAAKVSGQFRVNGDRVVGEDPSQHVVSGHTPPPGGRFFALRSCAPWQGSSSRPASFRRLPSMAINGRRDPSGPLSPDESEHPLRVHRSIERKKFRAYVPAAALATSTNRAWRSFDRPSPGATAEVVAKRAGPTGRHPFS